MRRIPAALGLELVAKPTGEATVELERQLDGRRPQALRLPIEVLEDRFAAQLDLVTALDLDLFGGDVVGDLRAQWSTVISHEREPRTSVDPVAIEPEGVLALAIELYKRLLRVDRLVHSLHDELRRGSDRDTPGRADTQSGRPFRFRPFQGGPSLPRVRPGVSLSLPQTGTQIAEVLEQPPAVLSADRIWMELDAPQRSLAMLHRHQDPVACPSDPAQLGRQWLLYAERVVANRLKLTRDAGEERRIVMQDSAETTMHRFGRRHNLCAVQSAEALVAKANAKQRRGRTAERLSADAEVVSSVGPPRPRRDDHVVELELRQLRPAGLVVADDQRLLTVRLRQQLEEVVGKGVVIVDQQRLQRRSRPRRTGTRLPQCQRVRPSPARPGPGSLRDDARPRQPPHRARRPPQPAGVKPRNAVPESDAPRPQPAGRAVGKRSLWVAFRRHVWCQRGRCTS